MAETKLSCKECGKVFEGEKAKRQLTGHMMSHKRKAKKKKEQLPEKVEPPKGKINGLARKSSGSPDPTGDSPFSEAYHQDIRQLTPEEAAIVARVESEDDEWENITEEDMEDFSLSEDQFEWPEEAKKQFRNEKLTFRWIERKPERIDELKSAPNPFKWRVCNRIKCTFFKDKDFDPITGGIHRYDQILAFQPWISRIKRNALKQELADIQDASGDITKKHGMAAPGTGSTWKAAITDEDHLADNPYRVTSGDDIQDPGGILDAAQNEGDSTPLDAFED